jgi:hypothetical protein
VIWTSSFNRFWIDFLELIWIIFFEAFRTYTVTDISLGMLFNIDIDPFPIALILSNLLAERA